MLQVLQQIMMEMMIATPSQQWIDATHRANQHQMRIFVSNLAGSDPASRQSDCASSDDMLANEWFDQCGRNENNELEAVQVWTKLKKQKSSRAMRIRWR